MDEPIIITDDKEGVVLAMLAAVHQNNETIKSLSDENNRMFHAIIETLYGIRVGSIVTIPDGRRFKVARIEVDRWNFIQREHGLRPWITGHAEGKNGKWIEVMEVNLFGTWTVVPADTGSNLPAGS